ncbi:MAG: nucleotidyltransferase family protein [Acidobacteria bacterium]|nr:nucleotidyltransferase family protein [Acidobacteriota bacterium]
MRSKSQMPRLTTQQILRLLKRHNEELKQYSVKRIGLFGSYARGRQNQQSDIDFLVEFREPSFDNFMNLAAYLETLLGRKVDILTPDGVEGIRIKELAGEIKKSVVYV